MFDSITSPATGQYTSDAALTDSTEPKLSPALYLLPEIIMHTALVNVEVSYIKMCVPLDGKST